MRPREERTETTADETVSPITYCFLDVGSQKYGECTLIRCGDLSVLIDGSHEADFEGQEGYRSVPEQLEDLFDHPPPFDISLLIVTHCHADHIGCLPALVAEGVIRPQWALVTDPRWGFGRTDEDDSYSDQRDDRVRALTAALREEDVSDLSDADLERFIADAMSVESKYQSFITKLESLGPQLVLYKGQALPSKLAELLRPASMTLLGPTRNQLELAAKQIATTNTTSVEEISDSLRQDAGLSNADLYRAIVSKDADSGQGRGHGMNCQSITFAVGPPGSRALLAGDMQFAEPGVSGADTEVQNLRAKVASHGPYKLFKTTHHTSHNGQDDDFLTELGDPAIIVHSGGLNDKNHPYPSVLKLLKSRSKNIKFARTDRNGLIRIDPHLPLAQAITKSTGRLNDFTDNAQDPGEKGLESPLPIATPAPPYHPVQVAAGAQVVIVNLPNHPCDLQVAGVDIVVRNTGPATGTTRFPAAGGEKPDYRNTGPGQRPQKSSVDVSLASGRTLRPLLFVTDSRKLAENIGGREARAAIDAMSQPPHTFCDLSLAKGNAVDEVRHALRTNVRIVGVVLAGGYDIVPSPIVDVLPPKLRQAIGPVANADQDQFLVWSDEPFGDLNNDQLSERPVSRIPDARDATLFLTALEAKSVRPNGKFGIRNFHRPFAENIWGILNFPNVSNNAIKVSETFVHGEVEQQEIGSSLQYFMLHGSSNDATLFTGEDSQLTTFTPAFKVQNVPPKFDGVVFSGCCFGALTVAQKAIDVSANGGVVAPRSPDKSIALSYLKAGANAFVGVTGAHYSGPDIDPDANLASHLHMEFWKALPQLEFTPSVALFWAKQAFGNIIARSGAENDPISLARRLKNRSQFVCLGLGW